MATRYAKLLHTLLFISLQFQGAIARSADSEMDIVGSSRDELLVTYPAEFFVRYQPVTALDMMQQVPGFQIDDGNANRGFIAAVGNILINDVYPSAKQDSPSSILARIPADQVKGIELIRGQVRGIDLQGRSAVANVLLSGDYPSVVRWDLYIRHHSEGPLKPGVDISLSDRWRNVDYNAGVRIEREANGERGTDRFFNVDRTLTQRGVVSEESTGIDLTGTLYASALWGQTLTQFNSRLHYETRNPLEKTFLTDADTAGGQTSEYLGSALTIKQFEFGVDASRKLSSALDSKAILLFSLEQLPRKATRRLVDESNTQTLLTVSDTTTDSMVMIGRIELDWRGAPMHHVQFNVEGAFNAVDGTLFQTRDTGAGPTVVDVPGANTRVEEVRGDFLLKDTWTTRSIILDYGLGAEVSVITQTGDASQERHLFYLKPEVVVTYPYGTGQQARFRIAREVAQLNFDDFITATAFEDDDINLGNPNLRPDTTWVAELGHEWRVSQESVYKLKAFHHWIDDVLDVLPLTPTLDAPGNIGKGRRWGFEFEGTIPLEALGLSSAKIDLVARWQDSVVSDPVTGRTRVLSGETGSNAYRTLANFNKNNRYFVRADYRQDLPARVAWGWTVAKRDKRPSFGVNELDIRGEGYAVNAFVETTRWKGLKVSLVGNNLLNFRQTRERTLYQGRRNVSPVNEYQYLDRFNGRRFNLMVSGSF